MASSIFFRDQPAPSDACYSNTLLHEKRWTATAGGGGVSMVFYELI